MSQASVWRQDICCIANTLIKGIKRCRISSTIEEKVLLEVDRKAALPGFPYSLVKGSIGQKVIPLTFMLNFGFGVQISLQ